MLDPSGVFGEEFKVVQLLGRKLASPLMVNRGRGAGVFELIQGDFDENALKLSIVDFFDFQVRGWREFRYFLTKVEYFAADQTLIGREALVEAGEVCVVWRPKSLVVKLSSESQ